MLEVEDLRVRYGTVEAVKGISFHVSAGAIISLIGANGAGKTTSLRAITGLVRASGGDVRFEDRSLIGLLQRVLAVEHQGRRLDDAGDDLRALSDPPTARATDRGIALRR